MIRAADELFLSTLSLRRATGVLYRYFLPVGNFYPRSPCGERHPAIAVSSSVWTFLSTLSLRRATGGSGVGNWPRVTFLSTLSLRRATPIFCKINTRGSISIHALLAESDRLGLPGWLRVLISIHALLAESDHYDNYNLHCVDISIHALLAESDEPTTRRNDQYNVFLSTLSLRRATGSRPLCARPTRDFYPRSPCGERHNLTQGVFNLFTFLSTLSLRRATVLGLPGWLRVLISIHALLAESDAGTHAQRPTQQDFYPRSPCGERRKTVLPVFFF